MLMIQRVICVGHGAVEFDLLQDLLVFGQLVAQALQFFFVGFEGGVGGLRVAEFLVLAVNVFQLVEALSICFCFFFCSVVWKNNN